jgi:hypothetical protein
MEGNAEASRLEKLWGGEFGDAYLKRNCQTDNTRGFFGQGVGRTGCQYRLGGWL